MIFNSIQLRRNYDDDLEQFARYDGIYGIAARLGYSSAEEAWADNPTYTINLIDNKLTKINKMAKKLVTVTWSISREVEVPDDFTIENAENEYQASVIQIIYDAGQDLNWKSGEITRVDEIPD